MVGLLAGGDSDCDYPMNDYFQMLSVCYNRYSFDSLQLAHWLNPRSLPVTHIDGSFGGGTAIGGKKADTQVAIYPNPATTEIRLTAENEMVTSVTIFDFSGRVVLKNRIDNKKNVTLNVGRLPAGVYVCSIEFANGDFGKTLIIKE